MEMKFSKKRKFMKTKFSILALTALVSATSFARPRDRSLEGGADRSSCTTRQILRVALAAESTFNAETGEMFEGSDKVKVWNQETAATVASIGNSKIDAALRLLGYNIGSRQPGYNSCALVVSEILSKAGCNIRPTQDVNNLIQQALKDSDQWQSSYFRHPGCIIVWYSRAPGGYPMLNENGKTVMVDEKGTVVKDEDQEAARRAGRKLKAKGIKMRHVGLAYVGDKSIENTSWKSRVEMVSIGNLQKTFAYGGPSLYICPRQ